MNLTKSQLIIVAVVLGLVLIFGLIFAGILPGLRNTQNNPQIIKGSLEVWGLFDNQTSYFDLIASFKTIYPGIEVHYREFDDEAEYKNTILNALASGEGPDIFMIENSELKENLNRLVAAPNNKFNLVGLRQLFPQVVEKNFVANGNIYALPLSIDTLALFYNRDLMDQAAATAPETWEGVLSAVAELNNFYKETSIRSVALGGSNQTVRRAGDILSLLMLQTGADLTRIGNDEGTNALNFYREFGNQNSAAFGYNDSLGNALDGFSRGKIAMMFDYQSAISEVKKRNNFLDFDVAPAPQPSKSNRLVSYPKYFGFAVSKSSKNPLIAWDFIVNATSKKENAKLYLTVSKKPPALRTLITEFGNDLELGVFTRQALIADSWGNIENNAVSEIFSNAIQAVVNQKIDTLTALRNAQGEIYKNIR